MSEVKSERIPVASLALLIRVSAKEAEVHVCSRAQ